MWIQSDSGILINTAFVREIGQKHETFMVPLPDGERQFVHHDVYAFGVGEVNGVYTDAHRHLTQHADAETAYQYLLLIGEAMVRDETVFLYEPNMRRARHLAKKEVKIGGMPQVVSTHRGIRPREL